jgi:hypothetical protein
MTTVVPFSGTTRLDIPAARVLQGATDAALQTAVVIGWDAKGEFYFASSAADGAEVLWLIKVTEKKLMDEATAP